MTDLTNDWYYSDPLAAAWMAKHFGMILQNKKFCSSGNMLPEYIPEMIYDMVRAVGERYYIHPDSVRIITPNPSGDLIMSMPDGSKQIVMRMVGGNPIRFMWPEKKP